jgi:hypothetical protein
MSLLGSALTTSTEAAIITAQGTTLFSESDFLFQHLSLTSTHWAFNPFAVPEKSKIKSPRLFRALL